MRPTGATKQRDRRLWTIIGISIWERYSYDCVMVLLPLFLIGPKVASGFGWAEADALRFTGGVLAAMQIGMYFGGLATDKWLGSRRALLTGAFCMLFGHILLLGPVLGPALSSWWVGADVRLLLQQAPQQPGELAAWTAVLDSVREATGSAQVAAGAAAAYAASAWSFYLGLSLLVVGNSLFKPTITLLPGRLGYPTDQARDAAYTYLYMGRNLGIALAGIVTGIVAQTWGWHQAFFTGAIGMCAALLIIRWAWRPFLRDLLGGSTSVEAVTGPPQLTGNAINFGLILFVAIFVFSVIYDQSGGFGATFSETKVNRGVFGMEIPVPWLLALNPIIIVLITPWVGRKLLQPRSWLARMNSFDRYAFSFLLLGIGTALYLGAAMIVEQFETPMWWWIAGAIGCFTLAEILIAPIGESTISKVVPARWQTQAMGLLFAFIGLGGWLSGLLGAAASNQGAVSVFLGLLLCALCCAAMMRLLSRRLPHLAL